MDSKIKIEKGGSVKRTIRLTDDQIGPYPVPTESLWFDIESDDLLRLKSIPFFVDELSFDDVVSLTPLGDDEWRIAEVVQGSGNSPIWLLVKDEAAGRDMLASISALGCGVEGGVFDGYYAINLPAEVDWSSFMDLINEEANADWLAVDYPSIRHDSGS